METGKKLLEIMAHRRSVRTYTGETVSEGNIERILQAAVLAASGRAKRPWEFVVVRDKEKLEKLSHCRDHGAAMLAGADCAVVVFGDEEKTDVWTEDCSIAMANMYLMADALGVGCCWIQGRGRVAEDGQATEDFVRQLLGVPENCRLEAILSLGMPDKHPGAYDETQVADLIKEKVHWEKF